MTVTFKDDAKTLYEGHISCTGISEFLLKLPLCPVSHRPTNSRSSRNTQLLANQLRTSLKRSAPTCGVDQRAGVDAEVSIGKSLSRTRLKMTSPPKVWVANVDFGVFLRCNVNDGVGVMASGR